MPEGRELTVCGQFYDLLRILEFNGLPSDSNPYLFNGGLCGVAAGLVCAPTPSCLRCLIAPGRRSRACCSASPATCSPPLNPLFNPPLPPAGDFVDRGSWSVEILTLLAFKCCYPGAVHLTRGNHEAKSMNTIYGGEGAAGALSSRL